MKLILNCKEASYLSSIRDMHSLSIGEKLQLWIHLKVCPPCRRFANHMQVINRFLQRGSQSFSKLAPFQLSQESRGRITRLLKEIEQKKS
ncbi:MAG: hypothetical protein EP338_14175 [Bacteroidetes bacterium]|nr:MAG: hypothetical protein EP338_14175 [Bacteroidota bacterium]